MIQWLKKLKCGEKNTDLAKLVAKKQYYSAKTLNWQIYFWKKSFWVGEKKIGSVGQLETQVFFTVFYV